MSSRKQKGDSTYVQLIMIHDDAYELTLLKEFFKGLAFDRGKIEEREADIAEDGNGKNHPINS